MNKIIASAGISMLIACIWIAWSENWKGREPQMNSAAEQTYQNPFHLDQEWPDYGIGDPFVMRYNGTYYLYCSTKDGRIGVKGWSSTDLTHWVYEGLVSEDPITEGAYAPEVVYWNGYFYMYTSPAGKGHYVLRSDKPTGPFTVQTDNLGMSIDGDVFIDDDGKWVFTHAGSSGIVGHAMSSPTAISPEGKTLNAYMGHWTEGSMIIKRSGTYFLTYTGNHVFSKGYRINYAVATDSPLGDYRVPDNNPILISTKPEFNGLGHSSTVLGPDLDSYYLIYHNLEGRSAEGPPVRHLNMDRLAFNGQKMTVLGPTQHAQPAPKLPVFSYYPTITADASKWEKSSSGKLTQWLSKLSTEPRFTAEYNFVVNPDGQSKEATFQVLFSYKGPNDYGYILVDPIGKRIALHQVDAKQDRLLGSASLPQEFDFGKLHTIRLEAAMPGIAVYVDGMEKINLKEAHASAGKIGYAFAGVQPVIQATSFSNEAGGSSDLAAAKPVPGTFEAVHYRSADGAATVPDDDGSMDAKLSDKHDWLSYKLNVAESGSYNIDAMLKNDASPVELEVKIGNVSKRITLNGKDTTGKQADDWYKQTLAVMPIHEGIQTLQIKLLQGKAELRHFDLYEVERQSKEIPDAYQLLSIDDMYGAWALGTDGYSAQKQGQDAKMFLGRDSWTDYQIDLDLKSSQDDPLYEGSVLFRATNESDFPAQVKDSFMGYELAIRNGRAILKKVNYERVDELTSAELDIPAGQTVRLRISAKGSHLAVYAGNDNKPLLQWDDSDAYMHGKVGIRSSDPAWSFSHVAIKFP